MAFYPLASSTSFLTAATILLFVVLSSVSDACFIRNCPKGGKRSLDTAVGIKRQCMKCGQGGLGQCVGPRICCSPQFGCLINTQEAEVCQQESKNLAPCSVAGDVCGALDSGNCVADSICCDSDSCAINERCKRTSENVPENTARSEVLQLIQKLLHIKDYD